MILHLTDPHFGAERPPVADALIELARARRPELIVLSGDITQRARPAQFGAARAFMDALCAACGLDPARDVLVIPGNHDIPLFHLPLRLFDPYGRYAQAFRGPLDPLIRRQAVWLIGVNTTRPWRHKHGEVSRAQIERVAARLHAAPNGALRVVVTHQPVFVVEADDRKDLLRGHRAAARAWAAAGADLLLSGHIHQSFVAPLPYPLGDTWTVQTGTAVSDRIRERVPNSVHVIGLGNAEAGVRAVVERWDWDGQAFAHIGSTDIPRRTPAPPPVLGAI